MTTNQTIGVPADSGNRAPEFEAGDPALNGIADSDSPEISRNGSGRQARRRPVYQFPAYDFQTALDIARQVEDSGGGTLTEETLAVNLGLSKSSSGFRLKCLAARHFSLLTKQGASVSTTTIAKAILKPTSPRDADRGYQDAFLSIPLFQAVAERYRGLRLPDSQTLRNVLEREFHVAPKRVQQAERMLLDAARRTNVLKHDDDGSYLVVSQHGQTTEEDPRPSVESEAQWSGSSLPTPELGDRHYRPASASTLGNTWTFSLEEIGQLKEEEFELVWQAIGIIVRARAARLRSANETAEGDPPL